MAEVEAIGGGEAGAVGATAPTWVRRLNLVFFLAVVGGGIGWFLAVDRLSERIEIRAEYLDRPATGTGRGPTGIGADLFREFQTGEPAPWRLGAAETFRLRAGESWKDAIERGDPSLEVLTFQPLEHGDRAGPEHGVIEVATVIVGREGEAPRSLLAVAVGFAGPFETVGIPALLLTLADPATHEFACRGVVWTEQPRTWFASLIGKPKHSCIVSTYRGDRSVSEAMRWADGPPWGVEILERAFSTDGGNR